jgi:hypothetical protein
LYFLLPGLESAKTIERELLLAKVEDQHMHFLARAGINLGTLHVANLLQRSDLLHGMGIGMVAGGVTGAVAGFLISTTETGAALGLGSVLILATLGALVGTWVSGMIAVSIPNTQLRRFQRALDKGRILLMVDVPPKRVREIRQLILSRHPEAMAGGQEAHMPAFP